MSGAMITAIGAIVVLVLVFLSALHLYWLLGGTFGKSAVVPERAGQPAFRPNAGATAAVAVGLLAAAGVVALRAGVTSALAGGPIVRLGTWAVAAAFLLRAIGDFRLVGLFRRERATRFAKWDARLYTPLSLFIGLGTALIAWGAT
jgi:hypothetical protein